MESGYFCELCNKSWSSLNDLNNHMLNYNHWEDLSNIFKIMERNLDLNMKTDKQNAQNKQAVTGVSIDNGNNSQRSETPETQVNFNEAQQIKENGFTCELCCRSWQSANDYNEHLLNYDHWKEKNFQASMVGSDPLQKSLSEEDLKSCKLCGKQFLYPEIAKIHYDSKRHQKKMMLMKESKPKFYGECKLCSKFFLGAVQEESHFKSAKHLLKAGEVTESEQNMESEMNTVTNVKWCKLCDKFFSSIHESTLHFYGIKHQKKVALSKKEGQQQNMMNPTDKHLLETSQEIIAIYLASSPSPSARYLFENGPQLSCIDMATLLEEAVVYVVVNTHKCEFCKKEFKGSNQGKAHLSDGRHICRIEEAKTLYIDGAFAHLQGNSSAVPSIAGSEQQASITESSWQTPLQLHVLQQPTELTTSRNEERSEQNLYSQDENCRYDKLVNITDGLMTEATSMALMQGSEDAVFQRKYERHNDNWVMNQPDVNKSLFQMSEINSMQPSGYNIQKKFTSRYLYIHNDKFNSTLDSTEERNKFNSYSQNELSSMIHCTDIASTPGQTLENNYRFKRKRDESQEMEGDRTTSFAGASKQCRYQSPYEREHRNMRPDKHPDANIFRERNNRMPDKDSDFDSFREIENFGERKRIWDKNSDSNFRNDGNFQERKNAVWNRYSDYNHNRERRNPLWNKHSDSFTESNNREGIKVWDIPPNLAGFMGMQTNYNISNPEHFYYNV